MRLVADLGLHLLACLVVEVDDDLAVISSLALLMILKVGPLSPIFLSHVTSIIRDLPFALQASSKVPLPVEPSGQGWTGFLSGALATGAVEVTGGVEATGAGALTAGAGGFVSSFSQEMRHNAIAAAPNVPTFHLVLDMVTSVTLGYASPAGWPGRRYPKQRAIATAS
jgi:hypothetical protein